MCFKNKTNFMLHIFATLLLDLPFLISNDTFHYLETVSNITLSADVIWEFPLTWKIRPVFQCGIECSLLNHCTGLEVCGGDFCRIWNGSFDGGAPSNVQKVCRRFKRALPQNTLNNSSQSYEGEFTTTVDINSTDQDETDSAPSGSTVSTTTLSNSGVSIQTDTTDLTTSQNESTTSIQNDNIATGTTSANQNCMTTFTTSNGSSREVPCHSDGYSWIVIQRRHDGSVLFNKTWAEYENGFGNQSAEIWLGNHFISELTNAGYTVLRIDLTSYDGDKRQIEYNFYVENQTMKYKLHISERIVSGIDSFSASNLEMFSTFDNDNDKLKAKNCAVDMTGGWWYADSNACTGANLNGVHWPMSVNDKRGVTWVSWLDTWTLKETRMMLRKP